jgi:hypothetical protein
MVDESLFAKEELVRNLALAENYIHESEQWEKSGDQAKAYDALRNADIIILEISSVINQMLNQGT